MNLENANSRVTDASVPPLILLVDTNVDHLWLVTELLSLYGCSSITATNIETALQMLTEYQPKLILLDLMLGTQNGLLLVERLRQQENRIPIIAITAWVGSEQRDRALLAGCDEYIEKPYSIEELESVIIRYLNLPFAPV